MWLLPTPMCFTFSCVPCVFYMINSNGRNRAISYSQRTYDSSPVKGLSQELNPEYWFLPFFPSFSFLSCFVCSVGGNPVSPAADTSQVQCWVVGCQLCVAVQGLICTLHTHMMCRSGEATCQEWHNLLHPRISRKPVALLCALQHWLQPTSLAKA